MTPTRESRYKERIKELELSIKNQAEFIANLKAQLNDGWLPIESAPKNREIQLYEFSKYGHQIYKGKYQTDADIEEWCTDEEATEGWYEVVENQNEYKTLYKASPTRWKPLPLPPAPKE